MIRRSLGGITGALAGWALLASACAAPPEAPAALPVAEDDGARSISIQVRDEGYDPAVIEIPAGQAVRLEFHSETDSFCMRYVQSESLGIEPTLLPKGQTTMIDVGPQTPGKYGFVCGMGMVEGTVLVENTS